MNRNVKNSNSRLWAISASLLLFLLTESSYAQSATKAVTACPATLITRQSIDAAPDGFSALDSGSGSGRLITASFYSGAPDKGGALAPDGEENGHIFWSFGAAAGDENWIVCHYSDTRVRLARKLPAGVTSCRIAYRQQGGRRFVLGVSEIVSIQCTR